MWEYNHTNPPANGEYLMHYGVPGMRWGVRKTKYISETRANRRARRAMKAAARDAERKSVLLGKSAKATKAARLNAIKTAQRKSLAADKTHNKLARETRNKRAYTSNILAGAFGGLIVGSSIARKRHLTGKKKVASMLIGALSGATLGTATAAKKVSSNNDSYVKKYGKD